MEINLTNRKNQDLQYYYLKNENKAQKRNEWNLLSLLTLFNKNNTEI